MTECRSKSVRVVKPAHTSNIFKIAMNFGVLLYVLEHKLMRVDNWEEIFKKVSTSKFSRINEKIAN